MLMCCICWFNVFNVYYTNMKDSRERENVKTHLNCFILVNNIKIRKTNVFLINYMFF
jgi:hypothetical protein